jgi:hypothetical protein
MIVTVKEQVPVVTYKEQIVERALPMAVFPVQFRNYDETIHIQGTTVKANREYGFSFDIPGQADENEDHRTLLSHAGTGQRYWTGSLVIEQNEDGDITNALLLGPSGNAYSAMQIKPVNEPCLDTLHHILSSRYSLTLMQGLCNGAPA